MLGVQRLRELLLTRVWEGGRAVVASTALPSNLSRVSRQTTMATKAPTAVPLEEDEVLTEDRFGTKIAVLNRPRKLNALTPRMVSLLLKLYERWEKDPHVHLVILKGNGKGFCAGGDVAAVSGMGAAGNKHGAVDFFKNEYILNYMIGTYKKPHIAFLDGVVMGGGTGVSIHGRFRVATENTVFAMPETAIGLHPDVGASYFLSRLPGHLGEYLALTGTRLDGADMMATSLATHFVPSHRLQMLEERLGGLNSEDIEVISNAVDEHCDIVQLKEKSPLHRRTEIDSCFGRSSMEEIVRALEAGTKTGNPWYRETLNTLRKMSPISLKIALRSVREGRRQTLHQCLEREFHLCYHIIDGRFSKDFVEGCRSLLIDKDNSPKWNPPVLEQVSSEMVDYYFSAIQGEDHGLTLQLPVEEREGQLKPGRYSRL